ncbi:hypothetical protein OIE66_22690 [Nonomuraea sp. NBC_01738]|uniref:DUF7144 family membrane protein n=1 Tax=Nonomuraea sp. NBC_01738 TaxID=2976003 RepID=UPI002E0E2ED5|nr:hypothetical protein OIE66_22690 [Nonomuraea sp. NBC_01738]
MENEQVTGWVGWIWFAGMMMIVDGVFNTINGFVALFQDEFFVRAGGQVLLFDITGWGWVHLILGIALIVVGACLITGQMWARIAGIVIVAINAIAQMLSIPIYPWWSLLVIVLDVFILYALIVHGREAKTLAV